MPNSDSAHPPPISDAIVVGGGPAGVAAVGCLLQHTKGAVSWIDPEFNGGRINARYREVPSNTKVALFRQYATAVPAFRDIVARSSGKPSGLTRLEELNQEDTCALGKAGDVLGFLTSGLTGMQRVDGHRGRVVTADWDESTGLWRVGIQGNCDNVQTRQTKLLVYCTGSSPTVVPLPLEPHDTPQLLDLDVALKPSQLAQDLSRTDPVKVAVIGASHSAVLVLKNLVELAQSTHPNLQVRWFARSDKLKYAVYKDGWILYDNTGLKGDAAAFARKQLEGSNLDNSEAGKSITRVDCSGGKEAERLAFMAHMPQCTHVVQAVGYHREDLPKSNMHVRRLETPTKAAKEKEGIVYDHLTGGFCDAGTGEVVPGLFGAGIAFPELVTDPVGNVEMSVGFFKFMRFLKRVVPTWVQESLGTEVTSDSSG